MGATPKEQVPWRKEVRVPRIAGPYVNVYRPLGDTYRGPDYPNLVSGRYYDTWVPNDHCFVKDRQGRWHVFGISHPITSLDRIHQGEDQLFHAMAPPGSLSEVLVEGSWADLPKVLSPPDRPGEKPQNHAPFIVKRDDDYLMIYGPRPLRYAVSNDLFAWKPMGELPHAPEGRDPSIFYWDGKYHVLTCVGAGKRSEKNALLISSTRDLIHYEDSRVLLEMQDGIAPESPSIVPYRGSFYLFFSGWDGNWDRKELSGAYQHKTYVFRSDDPYRFEASDEITTLESHAPEILCDKFGNWYISSVEYPSRGLSLAPLVWE